LRERLTLSVEVMVIKEQFGSPRGCLARCVDMGNNVLFASLGHESRRPFCLGIGRQPQIETSGLELRNCGSRYFETQEAAKGCKFESCFKSRCTTKRAPLQGLLAT
jgi:hypothetical protein